LANANEWFKQRDDENFQKELLLIQEELKFLDEGKSYMSKTLSFSPFYVSSSPHSKKGHQQVREEEWKASSAF